MYNEIINPTSSSNIVRLFSLNADEALEKDDFLKACKRSATDIEFSRQLQTGIKVIMHDFTQYYKEPNASDPAPVSSEKGTDIHASSTLVGAVDGSD
jgi:hypothetical protein